MNIAIISGASSGMGRDFARLLAEKKEIDECWLIARRENRLKELQKELKVACRIFVGDLKEKHIFDVLQSNLKRSNVTVKWLISSAGFGKVGRFEDIPLEESEDIIHLNVLALSRLASICLPFMKEGSRIVHLSSSAAFLPQPNFAVYAATKSYVLSFSRALRKEVSTKKICVTSVCPGPVRTEFFDIAEQTGHFADYKKAFYVHSKDVVYKAYLDAKKNKAVSVYGLPMKFVHLASKVLPTSSILKFYE